MSPSTWKCKLWMQGHSISWWSCSKWLSKVDLVHKMMLSVQQVTPSMPSKSLFIFSAKTAIDAETPTGKQAKAQAPQGETIFIDFLLSLRWWWPPFMSMHVAKWNPSIFNVTSLGCGVRWGSLTVSWDGKTQSQKGPSCPFRNNKLVGAPQAEHTFLTRAPMSSRQLTSAWTSFSQTLGTKQGQVQQDTASFLREMWQS